MKGASGLAKLNGLRCVDCNSELEPVVAFTGIYDECEANRPDFGYELNLDCTGCTRTYTVGHLNNESAFSKKIEDC